MTDEGRTKQMPHPRPSKSIRVQVLPTPPDSSPSFQASSSRHVEERATASPALWRSLLKPFVQQRDSRLDSDPVVAVEWPVERRLTIRAKGKSKDSALVVRVALPTAQQSENDCTEDEITKKLYIPSHLLPEYCSTPLYARIHHLTPVELSLAILQPLDSAARGEYREETRVGNDHVHLPNGNVTISRAKEEEQAVLTRGQILREGDRFMLKETSYRILMLEPVRQGTLTPSTRIITTKPPPYTSKSINEYRTPGENGIEAISDAASAHDRSRRSLSDFDPDTFLASSLQLALPPGDDDYQARLQTSCLDGSSLRSSTSGSLTPRPSDAASSNYASTPASPVVPPESLQSHDELPTVPGVRFSAASAAGSARFGDSDDAVCWLGVTGLARAGVFDGDWVALRSLDPNGGSERLVRAVGWEQLDEIEADLPANPILLPPSIHRALNLPSGGISQVSVLPASFGSREPDLPVAKTITLARIATAEGVDKRYERSWIKGLKAYFAGKERGERRIARRGDVIAVPIRPGKPTEEAQDSGGDTTDSGSSDSSEDERSSRTARWRRAKRTTSVGYFLVTSLSYHPLIPLEQDFRSSIPSRSRAGELGCWVDVGDEGETTMVLAGVERHVVRGRRGDAAWLHLPPSPKPWNAAIATQLRSFFATCMRHPSMMMKLQPSVLVKGASGSGKTSLIRSLADELGFNLLLVECNDLAIESSEVLAGTVRACLEKAKACAPSLMLFRHVEAFRSSGEVKHTGRPSSGITTLKEAVLVLQSATAESGFPCILVGTTNDDDVAATELPEVFKQTHTLPAPSEVERLSVIEEAFSTDVLAPDVSLNQIARQTAALQAGDLMALARRAQDAALKRVIRSSPCPLRTAQLAGISINASDIASALDEARAAHSDRIGAPKIPNVSWADVGDLAHIKQDILDTVQLPLTHPELFSAGLKKRSGLLLYGPPGTGKTLLAKAVATSCSLNFFSVKGPELLNMYVGESEANVRRVFKRARDAAPCIVFMDELDSIAPKRGNEGDSGGVMDRIVSQLLAELDGMSDVSSDSNLGDGGGRKDVFVMGATNRPDLIDPALLRPGRFDKMLYLSVAQTDAAQLDILRALTRKFKLAREFDLADIAERCPFNYTGADFYALCSDAMLLAMTRLAAAVDAKVAELDATPLPRGFPSPLTTGYYLDIMATAEEVDVVVSMEDFEDALGRLKPSVSRSEMEGYERVQREFEGFSIGPGSGKGAGQMSRT